ncbi:GNAT family N-acetyltransferase [Massilia sp. Dwa41.01b]|uniref:GNAT family N-acetyltransferase n=1 Tax=unclassified Massilia TaxID=2609279 RepID=UPI0016015D0D|nr:MULTISPECIES: GNAT family N-acetyltransferase [unclassified Massilia]QNA90739.1 GNAT family N-acetyltransferase [Massilia sp. Dwa41.01b]QNA97976.1 GNAT family N-acetyltransferase [Massilia sp. Se16.2.3]
MNRNPDGQEDTIAVAPVVPVLSTPRLRLRRMRVDDAPFMLALLNDPSWHRFIGDRGIRTLEGAVDYIVNGPLAMVARLGFGFDVVELAGGGCPIGVCGLAKRDFLDDVDIGYAFLPQYWGSGYAHEAAQAVLAHARQLGLRRVVATVRPDNAASIRLLEKLGLRYERRLERMPAAPDLCLYAVEFA